MPHKSPEWRTMEEDSWFQQTPWQTPWLTCPLLCSLKCGGPCPSTIGITSSLLEMQTLSPVSDLLNRNLRPNISPNLLSCQMYLHVSFPFLDCEQDPYIIHLYVSLTTIKCLAHVDELFTNT